MNQFIEKHKLLILGIIIIISGIIIETNVFDRRFGKNHARKFESVLINKIKQSKDILSEFTAPHNDSLEDPHKNYSQYTQENKLLLADRGIILSVFKDGELVFWSNNEASITENLTDKSYNHKAVKIGHGWYFLQQKHEKNTITIALSLLKNEYPFENKFLEDAFHHDFNLTPDVLLSSTKKPGYYSIYDNEGKYLLSLNADPVRNSNELQRTLSVILYLIGFVIIILYAYTSIQKVKTTKQFILANIGFSVFTLAMRYCMYAFKIPYIFHSSPLFSPTYFAASEMLQSLGDLFINTLIILLFSVQFSFILKRLKPNLSPKAKVLVSVISVSITAWWFVLIMDIFNTLILNSSITLEPHKILQINLLSIVAYLVIATLLNAFLIASNALIQTFKHYIKPQLAIATSVGISVLLFILNATSTIEASLWTAWIFLGLTLAQIYVNYYFKNGYTIRVKMILVIFLSIFIVGYTHTTLQTKQLEIKHLYASNLENEQDPVTEMLLIEIEDKISQDKNINRILTHSQNVAKEVTPYLQKKYFGGFLGKYELKTTVCLKDEVKNRDKTCHNKFEQLMANFGTELPSCKFHFINNRDGSISYLHALTVKENESTLYIELTSKFSSEELGYPELLLDQNIISTKAFSGFSFAKYKNGNLIAQKGDYSYSLTDKKFLEFLNEGYEHKNYDKFDHYIHKANNYLTIVISSPETKFFDNIISFSYTFLFLFALTILGELFRIAHIRAFYSGLNFKLKIQFAIVGVLITSLILIGTSLILLNKNEYMNTQYLEVNEKINSVLVELEHKLGDRDTINENDTEYTEYLLNKFSAVFFADMHLYDLSGQLLASSRPEVFKHGLSGIQMNQDAFDALHIQNKVAFMHEENIGKMSFLSSYALLKNENNTALAYINLPYFTKQTILSDRLSSLAAALINIFVLMILLSVATAIFIANKVTYPLQLLKTKIGSISLGSKNEKIDWESNDEIGNLITDYNRMVNELEASAEKLAESERLQAWHEMAKQVAHEIKNPLTPMKLNIQFLKRAWDTKDDKFGLRLNKISHSLIEQIDALANTATEFSNFTPTLEQNFTRVNIVSLLDHACTLFAESPNAEIITVFSEEEEMFVHADKEKLLRVFNNLIKNAIQAIPKNRHGEIIVSLRKEDNSALIVIHDNGTGIAIEEQENLFKPNFTTKSSGMGLGLGIVKNILDSIKANIWFESKTDIGTRFYVSIPLID